MMSKGQTMAPLVLLLVPIVFAFLPSPPVAVDIGSRTISSQLPVDRVQLDGKAMTIVMDGQGMIANSTISFDFHTQAQPTPRSFADTAIVGMFYNQSIIDARGSGTRYIIRYDEADAHVVVKAIVYPALHAVVLNATIVPLVDIVIDSRLHVLALNEEDILPGIPRGEIQFSFFESDNIWGSYKRVDFSSPIWWARTPFLATGPSSGLLIGALTSDKWEVEAAHTGGKFIVENVIIDGFTSGAGVNVSSELLWMQSGGNFSALFMNYADGLRDANQPVRAKVVENFFSEASGACDWYSHYGHISEASVIEEIDALSRLPLTSRKYYIMDDGWGSDQTLLYANWSSWDPVKFPRGIEPCVARAHAAGLKYVVWNRIGFAPTWVQQNHPDWVAASYSEPLKDSLFNLTKPEVQAYISAVFDAWKEHGIDGLKVDFISYVMGWTWNAGIWNGGMTRTVYMNLFLDILDREAARCNISILLCGTPYGYPSLAKFPNLVASRVTGDSASQGTFLDWQVSTALMRSFWWARAFTHTPDPDAYDTRDQRSVFVAAATGGAVYYGNDYTQVRLDEANFAWDLRWDAPALPDNVAFRSDLVACRGTWHGNPAAIVINLGAEAATWTDMNLPNQCSVLKLVDMSKESGILGMEMCTEGGIAGEYTTDVQPGASIVLIFYTGEPPFGALSCAAILSMKVLSVTGSLILLAVAGFVLVRQSKSLNGSRDKA
jgi:hypothetical protein